MAAKREPHSKLQFGEKCRSMHHFVALQKISTVGIYIQIDPDTAPAQANVLRRRHPRNAATKSVAQCIDSQSRAYKQIDPDKGGHRGTQTQTL